MTRLWVKPVTSWSWENRRMDEAEVRSALEHFVVSLPGLVIPTATFIWMRRILILISLTLAVTGAVAPLAMGTRAEEQQGAALAQDFQAGDQTCSNLSAKQFELIGEYEMSRMIGNPAAHDAMNERMSQVMGSRGEAQAHIFLAQRRLGCANGASPPASFGTMMGVAGSYQSGSGMGSGMMGDNGANYNGGSGMMADNTDGDWGTGMIILVVLLGVALAAALAAGLMWLARRPTSPS